MPDPVMTRTVGSATARAGLVLGLHLVLLYCYLRSDRSVPVIAEEATRAMTVWLVPQQRPAPQVTVHTAVTMPIAVSKRIVGVPASDHPVARQQAPAAAVRATEAPPATVVTDTDAARPPVPVGQAEAGAVFVMPLDRFKKDLGKIDRELRAGRPAVPDVLPETPRGRMERVMASARNTGAPGFTEEYYDAEDGVVITKMKAGGGRACFMSGTVNFVPGILHDSARPKSVKCPPEREFRQQSARTAVPLPPQGKAGDASGGTVIAP